MAHLITTDYRSHPRIGQSSLKRCYRDPALYYQTDIARTREPEPSTAAQVLGQDLEDWLLTGSLSHCTIIPPEVLASNGARSGNKWKDFAASNGEHRLLKKHEYEELQVTCKLVARNIAEHEIAYKLVMQAPKKKVGIAWEYCGLELKSEIDVLHSDRIVDIKTSNDIRPKQFSATISNYGYDVQAAAYQIAVEQLTGELLPFDFVVIQNTPSYSVETYRMHEDFLELGRKKLVMLCEFYRACKENNDWHSETHGRLNWIRPHRYVETQMEEWAV